VLGEGLAPRVDVFGMTLRFGLPVQDDRAGTERIAVKVFVRVTILANGGAVEADAGKEPARASVAQDLGRASGCRSSRQSP